MQARLKKQLIPLLVLFGCISVAYLSFDWAMGALIHSRQVVGVPEVTGKSIAEALTLLSQVHLGITKEGEQFDKSHPAGMIILQNPSPRMRVREGRLVKVIISQGGETLFVPSVVGQPLRNAQTMLQNAGLSAGEIEHRPSLRYAKDQVMISDPPPGAVISKNALINLTLSDGAPSSGILLTPDFVGQSLEAAKAWASANRVEISQREETDLTKPGGEVIMQAPTADSAIRPGETLTVVFNRAGLSGEGTRVLYEVPAGSADRDVRILVMDETGEREVFRGAQAPGSRIDVPVAVKGHARARIFLNGIQSQEQELQ